VNPFLFIREIQKLTKNSGIFYGAFVSSVLLPTSVGWRSEIRQFCTPMQ